MTTTKKSFGFRLSSQAVKNLEEIHVITGMSKTAAIEFALAQMRANLKYAETPAEQRKSRF